MSYSDEKYVKEICEEKRFYLTFPQFLILFRNTDYFY